MTDWLDSDEFLECFYSAWVQITPDNAVITRGVEDLKQKIREHFVPKPQWIKITEDPATLPRQEPVLLAYRSNSTGPHIEPAIYDYMHGEWEPDYHGQRLGYDLDYEPVAWTPWPEFPE